MNLREISTKIDSAKRRVKAGVKMSNLYQRLTTHNYSEIEELEGDAAELEEGNKIEQTPLGRFYYDLGLLSENTYFAFAKGQILKGHLAPMVMGNGSFHVFGQKQALTEAEISKHFVDSRAKDLFLAIASLIIKRPSIEKARVTIRESSQFIQGLRQGKNFSLLRELPEKNKSSKPNKSDNSARLSQHLTLTTSAQSPVRSSGHIVPREINGKE